jgi:hypothetical protein
LGNKELNAALRSEMEHELLLSLVRVDTNRYKMYLDPDKNAHKVGNVRLSELIDHLDTSVEMTLVFEALWEQLYLGEGPFCFCAPYVPDDCPYQPVLAQVWQQTKPDPKWKPNWKQGDPPFCIRDIIKSETATAVNSLLMSRALDENRQLTDAEKTLLIYQWFSREKIDRAIYFRRGNGNDLLLQGGHATLNGVPVIEFEPNKVRIAGILYSTDDDKLVCILEDVATGKELTVQVTEKDENGNEQQVEVRIEPPLERELVANLQLVAEAPLIKSLFSEEEQQLVDLHIRLLSLPSASSLGKFSWSMQRALAMAQEEAEQLNHNYIGTGHLFLALLRENEGKAYRILVFGMLAARRDLQFALKYSDYERERPSQGELSLSPQAKKAIELAEEEAHSMNLNYVGTEHLLIGLFREGEGLAARAFRNCNITLEKVRSISAIYYSDEGIRKLDNYQ